tara:strand:+ start:22646 stop:25009 length:2364 start_codon:yes stop_codon:yes gene_type:complete
VNALLGIMGSGKSSVMDALCFALFGTFPALSARKLTLDDVIRSRPKQQANASVEIEFKARDNEIYTVTRSLELGKGTKKAEIRKGDQLIDGPASQGVTDRISKLLKIDYEVFSRAVYAEQNQLDQFLNIPKGQRMERIDRLLKIDRFETARKTAGSVLNKLSDELSSKELLSQDIMVAEELTGLVQLEKEKREFEEKMKALSEEFEKTALLQKEVEGKLRIVEEKAVKLNELKLRKEGLKERLISSKERLSDLGVDTAMLSPDKVAPEKAAIETEIRNLKESRTHLEDLEKKKAGFRSTLEVLEAEINKANSELARTPVAGLAPKDILEKKEAVFPETPEQKTLKEQIERFTIAYTSRKTIEDDIEKQAFRSVEFQKKLESCIVRRKNAKEIIDQLRDNTHCPLCESDIGGEKKQDILQKNNLIVQQIDQEQTNINMLIIGAKKKRDDLKAVFEKWTGLEKDFEKQKQENKSILENVLGLAKRLSELTEKTSEIKSQAELIKAELIKLGSEYSEEKLEKLKKKLENLANAEKAFGLKQSVQEMEKEVITVNKDIDASQFDQQELKDLRLKQEEMIRKAEHQKAEARAASELIEEKGKRLEDLNRKKELAEKYKKDIASIKGGRESLELFQNALKRTQESLRAEFIESVNQIMNDVWTNLYPYDDLSGVKLIVDSGDYVLSVHTSQGWVNVEGRVSGGERSLACLALRVAFSLALAPNLSWFVLDEPTHNLDVASIDLLGETLRDRLPNLIEQIFLITHEERLESAVSGNLYKLERNKELDEATRVVS